MHKDRFADHDRGNIDAGKPLADDFVLISGFRHPSPCRRKEATPTECQLLVHNHASSAARRTARTIRL